MKKKYTLALQRKKLSNRRAVSGILEAVMLIGIVTVGAVIVAVGLSQINLETLSCEIQLYDVYKVADDNYWVEIILYNNGDYTFDAALKYFDTITITNLLHDNLIDVRPGDIVNLEFQFSGIIGDSITMGFDVTYDEQSTFCIKKVEIWIKYYNISF